MHSAYYVGLYRIE